MSTSTYIHMRRSTDTSIRASKDVCSRTEETYYVIELAHDKSNSHLILSKEQLEDLKNKIEEVLK